MHRPLASVCTLLAVCASSANAQSIERIVPSAGAPRDLVIFRGAGLGGTTLVRFHGSVGAIDQSGGLIFTIEVPPLSVTTDEVRTLVPKFGNFGGCAVGPSSWAYGGVNLVGDFPAQPLESFFYMEEPGAEVSSAGLGSPYGEAGERAVTSFDISLGPPRVPINGSPTGFVGCKPEHGNPGFVATLENAPPGCPAVLVVGPHLPQPLPFAGGLLVVDPQGIVLAVPATTDESGYASVPLPIPDELGAEVAFQWAMLDTGRSELSIAKALVAPL